MARAACETVVWGNRLAGAAAAAAELVSSGLIDSGTKEGEALIANINASLLDAADSIESLLATA